MKKLLVYPDVPHFRSVAHLKLGKIFSLAVFLMVLFASGQQAKSEELDTAKIIWTTTLQNQSEVWSAKFFHNGDSIIVVEKNSVFIVDAKTGKICSTLNGLIPYRRINLSTDEKYIYGSQKYNLHTREVENTINPSYKLREIFLSPLGDKLFATTYHSSGTVPNRLQDSNLIIIDANSYQVIKWASINAHMENLRTTQDEKYLITDEYDTGCCWDLMQPAAHFSITRLRYSNTLEPAGDILNNGIINVWGEIHVNAPYTSMGNPIFSNDGKWMITHGNDSVGVWSTDTWELVGKFFAPAVQIGNVLFTCDSKYIITMYGDENKVRGFAIYSLEMPFKRVYNYNYVARDIEGNKTYTGVDPLGINCINNTLLVEGSTWDKNLEYYLRTITLIQLPDVINNIKENIESNFILYPNPTTNEVKVTFENLDTQNVKIELFDINGNLMKILSSQIEVQGQLTKSFNLNSLVNGTYFIKVESKDNNYTFKVIKL
jgi:hypothetical protein